MKNPLKILVLVLPFLIISCQAQVEKTAISTENLESKILTYDSVASQKYGADEYGMKKYIMAFLKRGPNREVDPDKSQELQMAHLANIQKMAEEGKLVLAGPFFGSDDLRGIYIFNVESIEEAENLTNTDPAIKAGILAMELKEWYGSAALMAVNDIHKTLAKKSITEN